MIPGYLIRGGLLVLLLIPSLTGCLLNDSGSESGTVVDMVPYDPDQYACSPLQDDYTQIGENQGVHGSLYYLTPDQPHYTNVADYFTYGTNVADLDLFFNQLFIPTRPFDRGFVTAGGSTITTEQGDTLYEYFALKLRGRLTRGNLPAGLYQMALLTDDGSMLSMDFGNGMETVVDNNGQHPTRMGCGTYAVELGDEPIPYELLYNQGPRYHIALTLMLRPWPADNNPNDSQCGKSGNAMYFDSTQDPPTPQPAYLSMLDRGWMPVPAANFLLPEDKVQNPCAVEAPVISNFSVVTIGSNDVTVSWDTDIASTSQLAFRRDVDTSFTYTTEDMALVTHHQIMITGLTNNTNYVLKAISKSSSGQSSESGELAIRTRR